MREHAKSTKSSGYVGAVAVLALCGAALSGCGAEGSGPEALAGGAPGEEPQQVDPGDSIWRQITLTFSTGTPLATVYVFNQALGSYQTGVEYWFVNEDGVSSLGRTNLVIGVTDETSMTPPPDPGYTHEQRFHLAENVSWGSGWTTDPVSGGYLHTGASVNGNFVGLRLFKNVGSTAITHIVWYQEGDPECPPCIVNVTPTGTFTLTSGSVTPPPGLAGYDISQNTLG